MLEDKFVAGDTVRVIDTRSQYDKDAGTSYEFLGRATVLGVDDDGSLRLAMNRFEKYITVRPSEVERVT